jgi:2-isopropylmalate synthase
MLPSRITAAITELMARLDIDGDQLGIHCQNDTACAVANTVAAVEAGVTHFQCTANGYGERPGNADLFAVLGNLQLKLGLPVLPEGGIEQMVRVSHAIAEIANIAPDTHQAYVGAAAFAHKAGLHASAIKVDPALYNHVDPAIVGNDMKILITEMAGRASVELKSRELGLDLAGQPEALTRVTDQVKNLEARGWSFEAADASFELLIRSELPEGISRPFSLESYRVLVEHREDGSVVSEATVKVRVRGERVIETAEGNGPVNALDRALRDAITELHPHLADIELVNYKVRILDEHHGTGAVTRVLLDSSDGHGSWGSIGVSENIIEASWEALVDSLEYAFQPHAQRAGGEPATSAGR